MLQSNAFITFVPSKLTLEQNLRNNGLTTESDTLLSLLEPNVKEYEPFNRLLFDFDGRILLKSRLSRIKYVVISFVSIKLRYNDMWSAKFKLRYNEYPL